MIVVKLSGLDVNRTIEIVHELRSQGLVQGQDFDFKFGQGSYDSYDYGGGWREGITEFTFYDERYATMFKLRWG